MSVRRIVTGAVAVSAILATACGGGETESAPAPDITVSITNPANGDTLLGTVVRITLGVNGIELAPAADARPGTAHHHLYLDTDFPALETPIPTGVAGIVHLGLAQTEYTWENVPPGPHRIIAVLADPSHTPLTPWVTDTINIVVVAPPAVPGAGGR